MLLFRAFSLAVSCFSLLISSIPSDRPADCRLHRFLPPTKLSRRGFLSRRYPENELAPQAASPFTRTDGAAAGVAFSSFDSVYVGFAVAIAPAAAGDL